MNIYFHSNLSPKKKKHNSFALCPWLTLERGGVPRWSRDPSLHNLRWFASWGPWSKVSVAKKDRTIVLHVHQLHGYSGKQIKIHQRLIRWNTTEIWGNTLSVAHVYLPNETVGYLPLSYVFPYILPMYNSNNYEKKKNINN